MVVALALVYYASARLGLLLSYAQTNVSPVWPPSGLALAALLLGDLRLWPGIAIGAFAANMAVFLDTQIGPPTTSALVALIIAFGNTAEAVVGALLCRRCCPAPLQQPLHIYRFTLITLIMCAVAAVVGSLTLRLSGLVPHADPAKVFVTWWLGDVAGVLILTPVLLTWASPPLERPVKLSVRAINVLLLAPLAAALAAFASAGAEAAARRPLVYLPILGVAAAAYHYGQRGAATVTLLITVLAVLATTQGYGPFAYGLTTDSLLLLQMFVALIGVTGLLLATDLHQPAGAGEVAPSGLRRYLPWLALLTSLAVTVLVWHAIATDSEQRARERFATLVADTRNRIHSRMQVYEQILRDGAALFAASNFVSRDEWRRFVAHQDVGRSYPGIQGLGVAEYVTAAQKPAYLARVRAEGFPDYAIEPAGARAQYVVVTYIEPFAGRNLRAFRYDMFSDSIRQRAILRARDTGAAALSPHVTLRQETDKDVQPGTLLYMPVYRNGMATDTVAARRLALVGFVYGAFRMHDLMTDLLGSDSPLIGLEIFDGPRVEPKALLYRSMNATGPREAAHRPRLQTLKTLDIAGQQWTIRLQTLAAFDQTTDYQRERIVLIFGILTSLLLFTVMRSQAVTEARALSLAQQMTKALRDKEALLETALQEKEILLKEVYHRVKNNLQVITSLFNLQARTLPDGLARTALLEGADRVRAMSLVHEKLYQSSNLASVALASYIDDLCARLSGAAGAYQPRLETDVDPDLAIGLEAAVPLGLILNELISNCLKHAFPEGQQGHIQIKLQREADGLRLEVADDGVGLPPGFDPATQPSLGLKLVTSLARQLDGRFEMRSNGGTHAVLHFRQPSASPR